LQLFEHPQGAEGAGADAVVEVEHESYLGFAVLVSCPAALDISTARRHWAVTGELGPWAHS
jgi:hypothetical protein